MEGFWAYVFEVFTVMHLAEVLLFSHPMPVGRILVLLFLSHPMPLRIWVVLCFVEVSVPWITEDHGSVLECWRLVLSAPLVSPEFV